MKHVVNPPEALLDPEVPPLGLGHEVGLGDELGQVLGQHHVTVLELVVRVLVTVVNVFLGHCEIVETLKMTNAIVLTCLDDPQCRSDSIYSNTSLLS